MRGHPSRCQSLQERWRVHAGAVYVRGAVDAQRLDVFGRNTPHYFFIETSFVVISRREHGSP